ncbi:hypothetical protein [Noviherbaspirillum massiliense]|uniref:hypothetical protein n=1 Tax=Noviherbaspirillum massiliense TaxID=1465823 RepID=UPI0002E49D4D|nr:hypothetical protein [Noviherbaspirillum massiliense]
MDKVSHRSSLRHKELGSKFIARAATACLLAFAAVSALAQHSQHIVDGNLWLNSSEEVRKAFLVGAGNMLAMETAYAKRHGTPPPVAGTMAREAVENLTLDDVSGRITRWYEAHPDRRNMPVMGVIWVDMVKPTTGK